MYTVLVYNAIETSSWFLHSILRVNSNNGLRGGGPMWLATNCHCPWLTLVGPLDALTTDQSQDPSTFLTEGHTELVAINLRSCDNETQVKSYLSRQEVIQFILTPMARWPISHVNIFPTQLVDKSHLGDDFLSKERLLTYWPRRVQMWRSEYSSQASALPWCRFVGCGDLTSSDLVASVSTLTYLAYQSRDNLHTISSEFLVTFDTTDDLPVIGTKEYNLSKAILEIWMIYLITKVTSNYNRIYIEKTLPILFLT